jgi:hypothetical protein
MQIFIEAFFLCNFGLTIRLASDIVEPYECKTIRRRPQGLEYVARAVGSPSRSHE